MSTETKEPITTVPTKARATAAEKTTTTPTIGDTAGREAKDERDEFEQQLEKRKLYTLHTILMTAIKCGRMDFVEAVSPFADRSIVMVWRNIIKFGMTTLSIDILRQENNAALRLAARNGSMAMVRLLLQGWNFTTHDIRANDNELLKMVALYNDVKMLCVLHDVVGLTTDDAKAQDNAALKYAAEHGNIRVLTCLRRIYKLTASDARAENNYALRMAARNGHVDVLRELQTGYGLTSADARADNNFAIRSALKNLDAGMLYRLRASYNLETMDLHANNDSELRIATETNRFATLQIIERYDAKRDTNVDSRYSEGMRPREFRASLVRRRQLNGEDVVERDDDDDNDDDDYKDDDEYTEDQYGYQYEDEKTKILTLQLADDVRHHNNNNNNNNNHPNNQNDNLNDAVPDLELEPDNVF